MTEMHPMVPPSEELRRWENSWFDEEEHPDVLLIRAYQAGADAELEACCKVLEDELSCFVSADLRSARRPKPPSLKQQAIAELDDAVMRGDCITVSDALPTIRRALEALPDD